MSIFKLKNVDYLYENSKSKVLSGITYNFEVGKFYAIIGKSGAGKSTLLSLLAGLDSPSNGEIIFNNVNIEKIGYSEHRRKDISLVFQNYKLIDYLTPLENLKLVSKNVNKDILLKLGLEEEQINRNVMKLSGGQQQRVAIARALVSEAPIILADEPTGNLDENTAQEIIDILKKVTVENNKCVIVVTHSNQLGYNFEILVKYLFVYVHYILFFQYLHY